MKYSMISCGPFGQEFSDYVNSNFDSFIECSYLETVHQKGLNGMNAIAGFYQFEKLDLSGIKWIHAFSAGIDAYLAHPALRPDVMMTRTLGYMDQRIGEFCLAYILADLKSVISVKDSARKKEWNRINLEVLYTKKILIYGTGFVGQGVAKVLNPLTQSITGISQSGAQKPHFSKVISSSKKADLSVYDIVINTMPLTEATSNYFNLHRFENFSNALFINVGRGKSLVEQDLIRALDVGHLRKAILDVFQKEPLPQNDPIWEHPNIVATPHHSGLTSLDDIKKSFNEVVHQLKKENKNSLFVDLDKGY